MILSELMRSRRTVHEYETDSVPPSIVQQAIELAVWAPNHKLNFPWRFVQLGPVAHKQVAELAATVKFGAGIKNEATQKLTQRFLRVGSFLVLGLRRAADPMRAKEDYASLACAVQNMSLFLWEQGYGSKWTTGGILHRPELYQMVEWNENEMEIVGLFWIGKPQVVPSPPSRPKVAEVFKAVN